MCVCVSTVPGILQGGKSRLADSASQWGGRPSAPRCIRKYAKNGCQWWPPQRGNICMLLSSPGQTCRSVFCWRRRRWTAGTAALALLPRGAACRSVSAPQVRYRVGAVHTHLPAARSTHLTSARPLTLHTRQATATHRNHLALVIGGLRPSVQHRHTPTCSLPAGSQSTA